MRYSNRDEPFRYTFPESLKGKFQITKVDGSATDSSLGEMEILDISWRGAKIATTFDFRIDEYDVELTLQFQIISAEFSIPGRIVHQETGADPYLYGIHLDTDEAVREQLTKELKAFAWKLVEEA